MDHLHEELDLAVFVGHVDVDPPLSSGERRHLEALAVNGAEAFGIERRSGGPELACPWDVSPDGQRLTCRDDSTSGDPVEWLRFLIAQLLKRGAGARRDVRHHNDGFTFDHRLDGMVVGGYDESGELFSITVSGNRVTRRLLRHGHGPAQREEEREWARQADQDYERERARYEECTRRRDASSTSSKAAGLANVVDLIARRERQR